MSEEISTGEMTLQDFILKCYDLFGNKIKIKYNHTTRGDTWEITVRAESKEEAFQIITWINEKMPTLTTETQNATRPEV